MSSRLTEISAKHVSAQNFEQKHGNFREFFSAKHVLAQYNFRTTLFREISANRENQNFAEVNYNVQLHMYVRRRHQCNSTAPTHPLGSD